MTKAVSNRDICFIKSVLLLYQHEHCSLNIASPGHVNITKYEYSVFGLQEKCIIVSCFRVGNKTKDFFPITSRRKSWFLNELVTQNVRT